MRLIQDLSTSPAKHALTGVTADEVRAIIDSLNDPATIKESQARGLERDRIVLHARLEALLSVIH